MADSHKQVVREKLEGIGYEVTDIPEGTELSADLFAIANSSDALVTEVKSRREDARVAKKLSESPRGEIVSTETTISHDEDISDIVHAAAAQIKSSQKSYSGLGVLWFRSDPALGIADSAAQMTATLLGTRHVLVREGQGPGTVARCHLATYSDFFSYKSIDLAVVEDEKENCQLLVNPYSARRDRARASRLFKFVLEAAPGAVVDLETMEESEADYILFGDFSRKDEAVVLEELKRRHPGKEFIFFDIHGLGGYTRV